MSDQRAGKPTSAEDLRDIVARGYCHDKNRHKELDSDLLEAIVQELITAKGDS